MLCLFGETAQFVVAVFRHLASVVSDDTFGFAKGGGDAPFHRAEVVAVVALRRTVHRLYEHHGHTLGSRQAVVVVREPWESQTFQEGTHLSRHLTEIDRRTEHKSVRLGNLLQNWSKRILEAADVRSLALQLAGHTGHAPPVVNVVKPYSLYLNVATRRFGAFGKTLQQLGGVHVLSRSAIDDYYPFHCQILYIVL